MSDDAIRDPDVPWLTILEDLRRVYLRTPACLDAVRGGKTAYRSIYEVMTKGGQLQADLLAQALKASTPKRRAAVIEAHQKIFSAKWRK